MDENKSDSPFIFIIGMILGSIIGIGVCALVVSISDNARRDITINVKELQEYFGMVEVDSLCISKLPKNVRVVNNGSYYHAQCFIRNEWRFIWEYQGRTAKRWDWHYEPLNSVKDSCAAKVMCWQYLGYKKRASKKWEPV